jgi:hypothetical protein
MKLIFCPSCEDVVRLIGAKRECLCGSSGGRYLEDGLHAEVWGNAVPLGFANRSFANAVRNRIQGSWSQPFTAFVIPFECATVAELKETKP